MIVGRVGAVVPITYDTYFQLPESCDRKHQGRAPEWSSIHLNSSEEIRAQDYYYRHSMNGQ